MVINYCQLKWIGFITYFSDIKLFTRLIIMNWVVIVSSKQ